MGKRIDLEDGFYRERRGKLVRIPDEWLGETLHSQTKRKRAAKDRAIKREARNPFKGGGVDWRNYRQRRYEPILEEAC